jgi:hypothetical protein
LEEFSFALRGMPLVSAQALDLYFVWCCSIEWVSVANLIASKIGETDLKTIVLKEQRFVCDPF